MQGSDSALVAELTSLARRQTFHAAGTAWQVRAHSTLIGHEDWVHSVAWAPQPLQGGAERRLLSAGMDRTVMVWEHDSDSGVWMCVQSMGDAGARLLRLARGVQGVMHFAACSGEVLKVSPAPRCLLVLTVDSVATLTPLHDPHSREPEENIVSGHMVGCVASCSSTVSPCE